MYIFLRICVHSRISVIRHFRCYSAITGREYSVYSRNYVEPIFRKEDQESLFQNEEARKIAHEKIKPAMVNDTCSEFYDKRVL